MTERGTLHALGCLLFSFSLAEAAEPNKNMLDDALEFSGVESSQSTSTEPVRIGLFCPDVTDGPVGQAMVRGAQLAIDASTTAGGHDVLDFELVRRWDADPWRGGAKVVTKLVFEDAVVAIIGGPDGAATHVAQQVATKAHTPLIAPISSDPSLTHTRVPWIFRLPPDDALQAKTLVEGAILPGRFESVCVVTSTDHDSRVAATELLRALEGAGIAVAAHLTIPAVDPDLGVISDRLQGFRPDAVIIRVPRGAVPGLVKAIFDEGLPPDLFLPWIPGLDLRSFPPEYGGNIRSILPFATPRQCGVYLKFVRAFTRRFGSYPPPEAAYAYDAVQLVIRSVRRSGAGRTQIREALAHSALDSVGVSGAIRWDNGGGNGAAQPTLLESSGFSAQSRPSR